MANLLQQAGAGSDTTAFAPLFTNRLFTGLWTNRSVLRDAATSGYQERYGMARQDSILDGYNSELSPRLTLMRRPGSSVYNSNPIPPVKRFYSFNTFTLTDESIRVMADTASAVYDLTGNGNAAIWGKSPGAGSTYFLGVGNILYMTNGVENKQWDYVNGTVTNWGIDAPTTAPTAVAAPIWGRGQWMANTVFSRANEYARVTIIGAGYVQNLTTFGTTGNQEPSWQTGLDYSTPDGSVVWQNRGIGSWPAGTHFDAYEIIYRQSTGDLLFYFFQSQTAGTTGYSEPQWPNTIGATVSDGSSLVWKNIGRILAWSDIGATTPITPLTTVVDSGGNVQEVVSPGKSGSSAPAWSANQGITADPSPLAEGSIQWQNVGSMADVQYGYAYWNTKTNDISNMSPASAVISTNDGETITVSGAGSSDPQVDQIIIFRTLHGGSSFLYAGQVPNPGGGNTWTFQDSVLDADLNTEWQAQRTGEGTPLPIGASCLGYHLGRIFAAVGNVVYISAGPDATVGGSSGNAGFNTTFTVQSKITRFWACPLGMVVFTVRDAYIILGSATTQDPLYIVVWIENLPLRSYDCFSVNKTTAYLLTGNNILFALDPSAGITEQGFPIADRLLEEFDASTSYVTYHAGSSLDSALYVANGTDHWYRMAVTSAPESGSTWSPRAEMDQMGCVQSVEVTPGEYRLLISGTEAGPILQRDTTMTTDNGDTYPVLTRFGSVVLAVPGQLAALSFITLESLRIGTRATLALLLGETDGTFEELKRTRQDPTNLPPSETLFSDRYHFAQNQNEAWCRHFQMEVGWPPEDVPNELLTFTIFGQTWQEMRAQ